MMSIKRRLIIAIMIVLSISVLIGSTITYFYAITKVRTEMQAAISVGTHIVRNAVDDTEEILNPRRRLRLVVADFDGDRHLVASLLTHKHVLLALSTPLAPEEPAPQWFARLVGGRPIIVVAKLPAVVASDDQIVLRTTSANEVGEAWSDVKLTVGTLLVFCVLLLLLAYWTVSHALRPVADVCAALSCVSKGDYSARLTGLVPSELEPLRVGFNTMVEQLTEMESANRSLTRQLVNLQEEERAQIARDLHDEVGPFLFATGADATMIRQFLATSAWSEANARANAIVESVRHMQKHLRTILARLRPGMLIDLGLEQAIRGLVEFWRIRRPDVDFGVAISVPSLGRRVDDVVFRLVQESLSNAIRHARPSRIDIAISVVDGYAHVDVVDDGIGFSSTNQITGFGLGGMQERVGALGGGFTAGNRSDGYGAKVSARVPLVDDAPEGVGSDLMASE